MDDQTQTPDDANIAAELRPHLDEAIARLPHGMRDSVVLYFFGNRTHKEVGEQLGLSEDAARKRITRALDRMREILAGRGIGVAASSLAISSALSFEAASTATAAPAGLLASTVNIALLSNAVTTSAAGGGSIAASIAQGVGRIMTLTKIKVAAAVAGADWLHVDVMDNHFVPNLTLGAPVVASLAKATSIPIDCHLMIDDPDRWAPAFVQAPTWWATPAESIAIMSSVRAIVSRCSSSFNEILIIR